MKFTKKKLLFSVVGLLLILSGAYLFLRADDAILPLATKYNFDYNYVDGEMSWATHIDTTINTTYETLLRENDSLRRLQCTGDSTHTGEIPFRDDTPTCLQGNGAKIVVPHRVGDTVSSYSIFNSPMSGGLLENVDTEYPSHFFDVSSEPDFDTKYFLIPFNGYEVPTYSPIQARKYLPIWKAAFQKFNAMDDAYFNAHIFVVGASAEIFEHQGKKEKRFSVLYYYQVDWAQVHYLHDSFTYSVEGVGTGITLNELIHDISSPGYQSKFNSIINFNKIKPITHIATKEQVKDAVKAASPLLRFDVNHRTYLSRSGEIVVSVGGKVGTENKCLKGEVILETAQVVDLREDACIIYD